MMQVTLFGTRGSLAAPGAETSRYGGNTSTVEVRGNDGTVLILDAGTGIRRLGAQIQTDTIRIDILLTHLHMDHIQGLGFFGPLYNPGIEVHIWGPASSILSLGARLSRYLSPPLFPVHLRDLPGVTCHPVPFSPFEIGPFRVQASLVCHPGRWVIASRLLAPVPRICLITSLPLASRMVDGRTRNGSPAINLRPIPTC
jgi:phosphoribosyl 1,2-cyclic phosphodiesterase